MSMEGTSTGTGDAAAQPTGSLNEAAEIFSQLLTSQEDTQGTDEATTAQKDEEPTTEGTETEGQPEGEVESAEGETEQQEQTEENEEQADQPQDTLYTVRIDGKEEQVTESELIAGYSRQSDYTRKTQAVAKEREALKQREEAVQKERTEYAELLPQLRAALEDGMGKEPDWKALRDEDPVKAAMEWQLWQERKVKVAATRQEQERIAEIQRQEHEALRNQVLVDERQKMLDTMPQWKDEKVATADAHAIEKTLKAVGFTDKELEIYDHRAMRIAWMAMKYQEMQAKQPQLKKKIAAAPVVKPGAKKQSNSPTDQARSRFNKSGTVKDAAALFRTMLRD